MVIQIQFYNIALEGDIPQALVCFRDSLMVRMSACRVLDRGSIPRRGVLFECLTSFVTFLILPPVLTASDHTADTQPGPLSYTDTERTISAR